MQPHTKHSHKRLYLLLTTVVVGAILLLTLMNDGESFDFFTGSSIGFSSDDEKRISRDVVRGEEIAMELSFDAAPEVQDETRFRSIRILFDDLSTKIKINEEELELKGLKQVEMEVSEFSGEIAFDEISISLKGEGEKLTVNGIEISAKGKLEISFRDLVYESLSIEEVQLNSVVFAEGSGELALAERLDYRLDNEEVELEGFEGDLSVGFGNESLVVMEGVIKSISVEGDFDLTLG